MSPTGWTKILPTGWAHSENFMQFCVFELDIRFLRKVVAIRDHLREKTNNHYWKCATPNKEECFGDHTKWIPFDSGRNIGIILMYISIVPTCMYHKRVGGRHWTWNVHTRSKIFRKSSKNWGHVWKSARSNMMPLKVSIRPEFSNPVSDAILKSNHLLENLSNHGSFFVGPISLITSP